MATIPETRLILPEDIETIGEIGRQASPMEACGLLLPIPHHGYRVVSLPNRSNKLDSFEFVSDDILVALETWGGDWNQIALWHTHPGGRAEPSQADLDNKPVPSLAYLVVALSDSGPPHAVWY